MARREYVHMTVIYVVSLNYIKPSEKIDINIQENIE